MFGNVKLLSNVGGILGGLFGDKGKPFQDYQDEYNKWLNKAQSTQQPYLNAGKGAIGDYQEWLKGQKDPSGFINNLMDEYQESPYAQYLQNQSLRAGQNAASASGLSGSTPLFQQLQQNAGNIASEDQNNWLQHVLGINTQYGQGQQNLMTGGQNAANALTNLYNNAGQNMAQAEYGKSQRNQNNFWNTIGNGIGLIENWL